MDWGTPLPVRRVKVILPREARNAEGSARLTIVISAPGSLAGWLRRLPTTLGCCGVAVATQSSVFFNFRNDAFVDSSPVGACNKL